MCVQLNSFLRHIPTYSFFFALVILTALGATATGIACLLFAVIHCTRFNFFFLFLECTSLSINHIISPETLFLSNLNSNSGRASY